MPAVHPGGGGVRPDRQSWAAGFLKQACLDLCAWRKSIAAGRITACREFSGRHIATRELVVMWRRRCRNPDLSRAISSLN